MYVSRDQLLEMEARKILSKNIIDATLIERLAGTSTNQPPTSAPARAHKYALLSQDFHTQANELLAATNPYPNFDQAHGLSILCELHKLMAETLMLTARIEADYLMPQPIQGLAKQARITVEKIEPECRLIVESIDLLHGYSAQQLRQIWSGLALRANNLLPAAKRAQALACELDS